MGLLADGVRDRIAELGKDQKEIAAAFHDELERGDHGDRLGFQTVEQKLSKLLNDKPGGEEFFWRKDHRLACFAHALDVDPEWLSDLRERDQKLSVLILDPRLGPDAVEYLAEREQAEPTSFTIVAAVSEELAAIRDQAKTYRNVLVVIAAAEDQAFFSGADIKSAVLEHHPRGYVVAEHSDLIPFPPPPPPMLVDEDGMPMIPHVEYMNSGHCGQSRWDLQRQLDEGIVPTFRLDKLLGWMSGRAGVRLENTPPGYADDLIAALFEAFRPEASTSLVRQARDTHLWIHDDQVFVLGSEDLEIVQAIREHHPVVIPSSLEELVTLVEERNPWANLDENGEPLWSEGPWAEIIGEIEEECGVEEYRRSRDPREERPPPGAQWHPLWCKHVTKTTALDMVTIRSDGALIDEARRLIGDLSEREFKLPVDHAHWPLVLREASRAPLQVLETPDRAHHVMVNLGAGNLLQLRLLYFPAENPGPIRHVPMDSRLPQQATRLDGGDVHVWLFEKYADLLEGSALPARDRRREAATDDDC